MSASASLEPNLSLRLPYRRALRKALRRSVVTQGIDYLNLTAMMDMMTIILVFLLKNMVVAQAAPMPNDDLQIPPSTMVGRAHDDGVAVLVSKTQILIGDDSTPVVTLPSRAALVQSGADARDKGGNANSLHIVPLANALASARLTDQAVRRLDGRGGGSEAVVIADGTTPVRLLTEVLYTLGQSGFARYHFLVMTGSRSPGP